jgi:hypothetical protein
MIKDPTSFYDTLLESAFINSEVHPPKLESWLTNAHSLLVMVAALVAMSVNPSVDRLLTSLFSIIAQFELAYNNCRGLPVFYFALIIRISDI